MSYNPYPTYHDRARTFTSGAVTPGTSTPPLTRHVIPRTSVNDSPSTIATSRHSTSSMGTVSSSAKHGRHTSATSVSSASATSLTRGARPPRILGPRLFPSAERFRLTLMEQTGLRTNYDAKPSPNIQYLTFRSPQTLMFEGCTLRPLIPGVPETGVITLRPLLPGVPETGVIRTAHSAYCLQRPDNHIQRHQTIEGQV